MKFIKFIPILVILASCGSSYNTDNMDAEQLFKKGKELFDDDDLIEAQKLFDLIKIQYPASQYADDAQFYLAEVDYSNTKFIIAAFNYNSLRRLYPSSDYNKKSLFKRSLCYYKLSPEFERDQEYTKKAIQSFQEFQYTYPNDSLTAKADEYLVEMRNKLAHRQYFTGGLYLKLEDPRAALIYFDAVINNYDDSKYLEDAYYGKIESLYKMRRYDEAESIISLYNSKFPNGEFDDDILTLRSDIEEE